MPKKASKPRVITEAGMANYIGRLAREKDVPTLLHAFEKLQLTWQTTTLLIVGGGVKDIENKIFYSRPIRQCVWTLCGQSHCNHVGAKKTRWERKSQLRQ